MAEARKEKEAPYFAFLGLATLGASLFIVGSAVDAGIDVEPSLLPLRGPAYSLMAAGMFLLLAFMLTDLAIVALGKLGKRRAAAALAVMISPPAPPKYALLGTLLVGAATVLLLASIAPLTWAMTLQYFLGGTPVEVLRWLALAARIAWLASIPAVLNIVLYVPLLIHVAFGRRI